MKEILTQYGDLCLVWFDTPQTISPAQSRELVDMVRRYNPGCLVNSRIGNGLGDTVYGAKKPVPGLTGQCLHATGLEFIHPATGEKIILTCPLPEEFTKMLAKLERQK